MEIIFFGSSNFAVPSLKALLSTEHRVSCVVTQPDRQKGRGLHLEGTVVKNVAYESGLEIYQPQRINAVEAIKFLRDKRADLFIVISYGQILSREVLAIPRIFAINVHASNLPKYRGAAPINWAIINAEKTTGVTIIKMTEEMDAGPIILKESIEINEEDTVGTLEDRLSKKASELLIDAVKSIEKKTYALVAQDESKVTFAPKLKKEDGRINWSKTARDIYCLIKGCSGWPGAYTYYKARLMKINKATVVESYGQSVGVSIGQIVRVAKDAIEVATGKGNLIINELQLEGRRKMLVQDFISGHKICPGDRLG